MQQSRQGVTLRRRNGIRNLADNSNITLYPNPAISQLTISAPGFEAGTTTVYNVNGQKLSEQKFTHQLDISQLNSGVYFVELKNGGNVVRRVFVKE